MSVVVPKCYVRNPSTMRHSHSSVEESDWSEKEHFVLRCAVGESCSVAALCRSVGLESPGSEAKELVG